MRGADNVLRLPVDRRHGYIGTIHAPKSFSTLPPAYAPYPPLVSGPGRYPLTRPSGKTAGAAVLWTFILGPLGLCYLSTAAGLLSTALTAGLLIVSGSAVVLAVVWPVAMLLSLIYATDRR
jgi:hypothetical protein